MTRVSARPLTDLVEAGWAAALEPVGRQVARMGEFLRSEIDAGRGYLPPGPDVLRAFTFPMAQVKVLIVGQDPYPTPGHAMGLSFSVAPGVRPLPRSLANIVAEYGADLGYPAPASGDLTAWAQRGVLLLNRVLTVRAGAPASHRGKGWEEVTECAIRALVARDQPLVAILWGRDDVDRVSGDRVGPPVAAVGESRIFWVASLQSGQRTIGRRRRRTGGLAAGVTGSVSPE